MKNKKFFLLLLGFTMMMSCCPDPVTSTDAPYTLNTPSHFPPPNIPTDNPLTVNKVQLGRMLFYETGLSEDNQVSCASCHKQEFAFGSDKKLDIKVNHGMTTRNSSTLFNLVYTKRFFWDGRTSTLEATCLDAMKGEQKFNIEFVKSKLFAKSNYKAMFKAVYNSEEPTEDMVTKALASFIRTMISASSKVDKGAKEGNVSKYLNVAELEGRLLFEEEDADCFHCHGDIVGNPLLTDNLFHNNGIDTFSNNLPLADIGLSDFTKLENDKGKFKTPSLRNLSFTKPYMHDGRFTTLDQVLNHYNSEVKKSATLDVLMEKADQGGVHLMPNQLAKLKAFLLAFDDNDFVKDTSFSNPF